MDGEKAAGNEISVTFQRAIRLDGVKTPPLLARYIIVHTHLSISPFEVRCHVLTILYWRFSDKCAENILTRLLWRERVSGDNNMTSVTTFHSHLPSHQCRDGALDSHRSLSAAPRGGQRQCRPEPMVCRPPSAAHTADPPGRSSTCSIRYAH